MCLKPYLFHTYSHDLLIFKGSFPFLLQILACRCLYSKGSASRSADGTIGEEEFLPVKQWQTAWEAKCSVLREDPEVIT